MRQVRVFHSTVMVLIPKTASVRMGAIDWFIGGARWPFAFISLGHWHFAKYAAVRFHRTSFTVHDIFFTVPSRPSRHWHYDHVHKYNHGKSRVVCRTRSGAALGIAL